MGALTLGEGPQEGLSEEGTGQLRFEGQLESDEESGKSFPGRGRAYSYPPTKRIPRIIKKSNSVKEELMNRCSGRCKSHIDNL